LVLAVAVFLLALPMGLAVVVDMQLERTQSRLVKFSTSLWVKQVAVWLQRLCQLLAIEHQQRMAVVVNRVRVSRLPMRLSIALQVVVDVQRFD
jgi:hypothetical protein